MSDSWLADITTLSYILWTIWVIDLLENLEADDWINGMNF